MLLVDSIFDNGLKTVRIDQSQNTSFINRKRFQSFLILPIVLEVDLGNGMWERAEIRNDVSAYTALRPNEHVLNRNFRRRKCEYWASGEPAKLRYALYQEGLPALVSESFDGYLPMGKVYSARRDAMAASLTPEVLRIRYQAEATSFERVQNEWVPKLGLLHQLGPAHIELEEIQKWTADIHSNPVSTREERDLAIQLQTKMLRDWHPNYDLDRLHNYCVKTVTERTPETKAARPVCWQLLEDATKNAKSLPHPDLTKQAWQTLQASSNVTAIERKAITRFLCSPIVAKLSNPVDSVTNPEALLKSDDLHIRIVVANWFLKHQRPEVDVIKQYRSSPPEDLSAYELIKILHFNRIHNPYTRRSWDLWLRALTLDKEYTISNLALIYEFDRRKFPKKFKASEEALPGSIKSVLLKHFQENPNSESGKFANLILQNNSKKVRSNRLNLKF